MIDAMKLFADLHFIAMALHHLIEDLAGNVDIAPQRLSGVTTQE